MAELTNLDDLIKAGTGFDARAMFNQELAAHRQLPGAGPIETVTINGGVITPTHAFVVIDSAGSINRISTANTHNGMELKLMASAGLIVTMKHNPDEAGGVALSRKIDMVLPTDRYILLKRAGNVWKEIVPYAAMEEVDLSEIGAALALKVDTATLNDTVALLAEKTYVDAVAAQVQAQIPDVRGLATQAAVEFVAASIPDVSELATKASVNEVAGAIPDVSGLATQAAVEAVAATIPDIRGLAPESYVDVAMARIAAQIPDIGHLATQIAVETVAASIPDVSGLASREYVDAAVENVGGSFVGDIRLLPFRPDELPKGWYFCDGRRYENDTSQAKVLANFPVGYKNDWNISTKMLIGTIDWTQIKNGTLALNGVTQLADGRIVAVGDSGAIYYGDDPANLTQITSGTLALNDVTQLADGRIVAVGASGAIYYGDDPANLTQITSGTSTRFKVIQLTDGRIVTADGNGKISYGTDLTNLTQYVKSSYAFNAAIQLIDSRIVFFSGSGYIYYGDNPANLTSAKQGTATLRDVTQLADGRIVAVGASGAIYYGDDPANLTQITSGAMTLNGVTQLADGRIIAVDSSGYIYCGDDPANLTSAKQGTASLNDVTRLADGRIVAVGASGAIRIGTISTTSGEFVEVEGSPINVPNLFYSDGLGYMLRAADGTVRPIGNVRMDIGAADLNMLPSVGMTPAIYLGV